MITEIFTFVSALSILLLVFGFCCAINIHTNDRLAAPAFWLMLTGIVGVLVSLYVLAQ